MPGTLSKAINLIANMGWRYTHFRLWREIQARTGLLKNKFPIAPPHSDYVTLEKWKQQKARFFFANRSSISIDRTPTPEIRETFYNIKNGRISLFNSQLTELGPDYDWVTNPDSGFRYDTSKHWTQIADYSREAGDIKYVWEKSRFSYLYDVIRYDYHYNEDCAAFVFGEISSWIKNNPINCGPNYRCSQEMSLRVLNWIFALYYYRDSPSLTPDIFSQMQHIIYWHLHHIYNNINFSRIAVRNNHAITETLALYLGGIYFPSMPGAGIWKQKGKEWFEEEIAYQVYEDGSFLQFSMNYHRVVAQLLTWGIQLSEQNGERFGNIVYDRARKSFEFLRTCMVEENGWLPNYGANDGALFFKFNNEHFRDYRPQLQALASVLGIDAGFGKDYEDMGWYGVHQKTSIPLWQPGNGAHSFDIGGYYVIREQETLTFIRCGNHKDRPLQADNLHIDIWHKGENILIDAGSYKYNTDEATMRYFSGTQSHNTVMLGDNDQMLKGGHFIWFYWSQCEEATLAENTSSYTFSGTISVFRHIDKNIKHKRTISKRKGQQTWEIKDEIINAPNDILLRQLWHIPTWLKKNVMIVTTETGGKQLTPMIGDGWYSSLYGQKQKTKEMCFSNRGSNVLSTLITIINE